MTARTLNKTLFFRDARSLDFLERELPAKAEEYRWQLEAQAVFRITTILWGMRWRTRRR
jgi:hypothetical protein